MASDNQNDVKLAGCHGAEQQMGRLNENTSIKRAADISREFPHHAGAACFLLLRTIRLNREFNEEI